MVQWGGYEGTKQVIIVSVFLALSFVVLSLRLFTRVVVTRNYGLEDLVITAAFCFSVAQVALVVVEVQHGQGLAQSALSADDVQLLKKVRANKLHSRHELNRWTRPSGNSSRPTWQA